MLKKLETLENIMKTMKKYRFYDTSILISYDGNSSNTNHNCFNHDSINQKENNEFTINKQIVDVHIIDFTHASKDDKCEDTPDPGYLFGLKNVIDALKRIKDDVSPKNCN